MLRSICPTGQFRIVYRAFRLYLASYKDVESTKSDDSDTISTNSKDDDELPEEPTTCCMSGCANCVWLDYVEKMNEYFKDGGDQAMKEIEERVQDPNMKAFLMSELRMREKLKKS